MCERSICSTKFHSNIRIALLKCLFLWWKNLDIQNTCTILVIWIGYLDNIANTNTRVVYYGVYSGIFGYPDIICTSRALNYLDRWIFINSSQYLNLGRSWIKRGSNTETIRINKWMNEMAGRFSSRLPSKTDWKEMERGICVFAARSIVVFAIVEVRLCRSPRVHLPCVHLTKCANGFTCYESSLVS